MRTDELIATLARDPHPAAGPSLERRVAGGVVLGVVAAVALFLALLGPRANLAAALAAPVTLAKTLLPLALAVLAMVLVLRAARPGVPAGGAARLIWAVPAVVLALGLWAYVATAAGQRLTLFLGHSIPVCLPAIVGLSVPILAGLVVALRQGAPVRPGRCGALAGLAAAGMAAALYSLFCTEDSPLFYGSWYSLGILSVAALGAVLGRRLLHW